VLPRRTHRLGIAADVFQQVVREGTEHALRQPMFLAKLLGQLYRVVALAHVYRVVLATSYVHAGDEDRLPLHALHALSVGGVEGEKRIALDAPVNAQCNTQQKVGAGES
jgi:hypothetical protein